MMKDTLENKVDGVEDQMACQAETGNVGGTPDAVFLHQLRTTGVELLHDAHGILIHGDGACCGLLASARYHRHA